MLQSKGQHFSSWWRARADLACFMERKRVSRWMAQIEFRHLCSD